MNDRKKNICITINSLSRGGAEKQCLLLARALKPYHNVTIVILKPEPIYPQRLRFIEQEKINHVYLSKNPVKKFFDFIRLLKKEKFDIIFSFLPTDTVFSAICGKLAGIPFIFGGIRNSHMAKSKFTALKWANNYLLNYTIANNFAAYRSAIAFGFKEKVFVISNGIDIRPYYERKEEIGKTVNIISLGRLVGQKEYGTALKCIAHLKKTLDTGYTFRYTIVGQGPKKKIIEAEIEILGLENEVSIVTNASDMYAVLDAAHIYLCSSSFEGVSNAIMEAMNCALPLVATDAGDNSRLVIHKKNGFIAPINSYEQLAFYLKILVQSSESRVNMGLESYKHLVENFSYETFQRNYLHLIDKTGAIQILGGEVRYSE